MPPADAEERFCIHDVSEHVTCAECDAEDLEIAAVVHAECRAAHTAPLARVEALEQEIEGWRVEANRSLKKLDGERRFGPTR